MNMQPHMPSDNHEIETPPKLFWRLHGRYRFEIDAAANNQNALCKKFYSKDKSFLDVELTELEEKIIWCNPPYGRALPHFTNRLAILGKHCRATCVALLPARTDTVWWHEDVLARATHIEYLKGRLVFHYQGKPITGKTGRPQSAPFPSAIVEWRPPWK